MSLKIIILRNTNCRTAGTKPIALASVTRRPFPTLKTNLVSQVIAGVMSTRVIPRDTIHATAGTIVVFVAVQLQVKLHGDVSALQRQASS